MTKCENCGYELDAHTNLSDANMKPKYGDVSICISCGTVSRFEGERLVPLTCAEYDKLSDSVKQEVERIQTARLNLWGGAA